MSRIMSAIMVSALALALGACQQQAGSPEESVKAIMAVEGGMRAAYARKDAAKLATFYTSDATIYVPSERPRVGTDAIVKGAQKDFADPGFHVSFTSAKVAASDKAGYSKGSFTVRYTNPTTKAAAGFSGYYLTVFHKESDGSWKAVEDMAIPAS